MPPVLLDWYPKVQVLKSSKLTNVTSVINIEEGKLESYHLAFLDWNNIYFDIQKYKKERSWYNVNLSVEALKDILSSPDWYTLQIPSTELEMNNYNKVQLWHELALALLKSFIDRLYNYQKNKFYSDKIEVAILDNNNPNFEKEYNFLVKKSEERLIEKLNELKGIVRVEGFQETFNISNDFDALYAGFHLYQPLMYIDKGRYEEIVKIRPVSLNKGERDFVEDLKLFFKSNARLFPK